MSSPLTKKNFCGLLVSLDTNTQRGAEADHTATTSSYQAIQTSQSPPYSTPLSTKTELRSARDHHVVDVVQQNTMVPSMQWADAHSDKTGKMQALWFFLLGPKRVHSTVN